MKYLNLKFLTRSDSIQPQFLFSISEILGRSRNLVFSSYLGFLILYSEGQFKLSSTSHERPGGWAFCTTNQQQQPKGGQHVWSLLHHCKQETLSPPDHRPKRL